MPGIDILPEPSSKFGEMLERVTCVDASSVCWENERGSPLLYEHSLLG